MMGAARDLLARKASVLQMSTRRKILRQARGRGDRERGVIGRGGGEGAGAGGGQDPAAGQQKDSGLTLLTPRRPSSHHSPSPIALSSPHHHRRLPQSNSWSASSSPPPPESPRHPPTVLHAHAHARTPPTRPSTRPHPNCWPRPHPPAGHHEYQDGTAAGCDGGPRGGGRQRRPVSEAGQHRCNRGSDRDI